ncbi:MAG: solute carrier family 23 protein, partial [Planctomycetota bacterium]
FIAVSITAVQKGGVPLLMTLVVISACVQFVLAARLSLLRKLITPTVGGVAIMLIAVTVFPHVFPMLTEVPDGVDPLSYAAPVTVLITFLVSIAVTLFASGQMRLWGPLIGVVVGVVVASFLGILDLSGVREAAWFGFPSTVVAGPDLSFDLRMWSLLPAFVIVTVVGAIETYGDGIAIQRVSARTPKPVDFKTVQGAVYADGLGNLLSGMFGTMPNTTYSTSIAVVELTGVASRRVGVYGGVFMIVIALFPKVSALIQAIPNPVVAAYVTLLLVLLFGHGMRLLFEGGLSFENGVVACLAFWLGVGFQNQWIFPDHLPAWAHSILDNGMTAGSLTALALTAVLALKHRSQGRVKVEASLSGIRPLHSFLEEFATKAGWDRPAIDRLLLAAEEATLFLIQRRSEKSAKKYRQISVFARDVGSAIALEFVGGPGDANIESLLEQLKEQSTGVEEAGLHILRLLVKDVGHFQFHDNDVLQIVVESRPLS